MKIAAARLSRHPLARWDGPEFTVRAHVALKADGAAECRFEVLGEVGALAVPVAAAPARTDGLWRHTCFEAFVARAGAPAYAEFNYAPSGEWAAYAFDGYREAAPSPRLAAPAIRAWRGEGRLELAALTEPGAWPAGARLEVGLAAVLELRSGALGYFALAHPAPRPDFHDRRGFALALDPTRP
ncbi:MAG: DOMON-like domain-containing protein [Proteobacteria bacterium]|nr:DOMON-like domain-containing protein [Pseudomonadota bacterium]